MADTRRQPYHSFTMAHAWAKPLIACMLFISILLVWCACSPSEERAGDTPESPLSVLYDERQPDSMRIEAAVELVNRYSDYNLDSFLLIQNLMQRLGQERNKQAWEGHRLITLGTHYFLRGMGDSALICYQGAYQLASDTNTVLYPRALSGMGLYHYQYGQIDSAIYYFEQVIAPAKRSQDYALMVRALVNLGVINLNQEKNFEALNYFEKAKPYAKDRAKAVILGNVATLLIGFQMQQEGRKETLEMLTLAQKQKDTVTLIGAYRLMIATERLDFNNIKNWVDTANALATQPVYQSEYCHLLRAAGFKALHTFDQRQQANDYLQEAISKGIEIVTPQVYRQLLSDLAQLRLMQGKPRETVALYRKIVSLYGKTLNQYPVDQFQISYTVSQAFDSLGQRDSAFYYLKRMDAFDLREKEFDSFYASIKEYLNNKYTTENEVIKREKAAAEALANSMSQRQSAINWLFALAVLFLLTLTIGGYLRLRANKRHARALALKNEALAKSNAQLNRFSNIVSHDILSNLDLVLSTGNVLVGPKPKQETLLQYYETAQRTNRQLKQYCLNLLEAARQDKLIEISDPMPTIQQLLARFSPALKEANFQVSQGELSPTLLPTVLVQQLFQNLISNAIHHAAASPAPLLRISEETNPAGMHFWIIEDNGPGIPETERETIFSRQEKSDGPGQQMGLSLLRASLRERGADIFVEESSGGGARFVVSLPN